MSIDATEWVMAIEDLSSSERVILLVLAWHHNGITGLCYPGLRRLAKETGISRRHILKVLNVLENKVGLKREPHFVTDTKGRTSNQYVLPIPIRAKKGSVSWTPKSGKAPKGGVTLPPPSGQGSYAGDQMPPKQVVNAEENLKGTALAPGEANSLSEQIKTEKDKPATKEEALAILNAV